MHSNKILLSKLESWIKDKMCKNYTAVWIDICNRDNILLDKKYYDSYEVSQSYILKYICETNSIPFEIYKMNSYHSDSDRISEYSKFLLWKSENYNTILFSKILKEQIYFGEYKRYGKDELDFFPFANLNQSQIDSLISYIESEEDIISVPIQSKLEWLYHQDVQFKIISSNENPTKHIRWGTYSLEQKSLIAKYYALIKDRKHKISKDKYFEFPLCP